MTRFRKYSDWLWILVSGVIVTLGLLNLLMPQAIIIQKSAGTAEVSISSDKTWLFPLSDCPIITWQMEGISALYVGGEERIGSDSSEFCPQLNQSSLKFEVVDQQGISRIYNVRIRYWLDELLYALSFAGIVFAGIASVYYLVIPDMTRKAPIGFSFFLLVCLIIGVAIARNNAPPAPAIDLKQGEISIYFTAEYQEAFFPEECIEIRWQVVNADQISINGIEQALDGVSQHCQQDGDTARLRVNGLDETFELPLRFLFPHLSNTSWYAILCLASLILCALIYLPLFGQSVYRAWQTGRRADFVVIGALFLVAVVLYLPFGWTHVGHWEEWVVKAYIQGMPNDWLDNELRTRLFVIVPHTLAHILTPNSFLGYNLINMMMFFGKSLFLYCILRKLNLSLVLAFLISALFMVYPVNTAIMSLRSFPMQFSAMSLLLAGYLILNLREHPSRLGILGVWLALLFSVGSNESGYLIILIAPLFWLKLEPQLNWKSMNLTALWLMMPALRLVFTFGLLATGRGFYLSDNLDSMAGVPSERFKFILRTIGNSYLETFPKGWAQALNTLPQSGYVLLSLVGAGIVMVTAWWLLRQDDPIRFIRHRMILVWGFIFLIPSVGVLILLDFYRTDTWRVFFYAPISGAIVIIGLLSLICSRIANKSMAQRLFLIVVGIVFIPAFNRALTQHEFFVNQAIAKEDFFHSFVEQAPAIDPSAQVIVVSDLKIDELPPLGLHELIRRDMLPSALYLLYDKAPPDYVFVCVMDASCSADDDGLTIKFPFREIPYNKLLIFHLDKSLNLTLLSGLDDLSGFPDAIENYRPQSLIEKDTQPSDGLGLLP